MLDKDEGILRAVVNKTQLVERLGFWRDLSIFSQREIGKQSGDDVSPVEKGLFTDFMHSRADSDWGQSIMQVQKDYDEDRSLHQGVLIEGFFTSRIC